MFSQCLSRWYVDQGFSLNTPKTKVMKSKTSRFLPSSLQDVAKNASFEMQTRLNSFSLHDAAKSYLQVLAPSNPPHAVLPA